MKKWVFSVVFAFIAVTVSDFSIPKRVLDCSQGQSVETAFFSPCKDYGDYEFVETASFKTFFYSSGENRKHNIKLASEKIDGKILESGAEFSFNETVGARTEKNGFLPAKIIFSGRFTEGVGGGVCQVSTTLYNAVVNAGLKITEYHQHSLLISYVPPATDAMVNSVDCDLKFVNDTGGRIYIKAFADDCSLTVRIYGKRTEYVYKLDGEITETLQPLPPVYVTDDEICKTLDEGETKIISYGLKGAIAKSYISCYRGEKLIYKKPYRVNVYRPTATLIAVGGGYDKIS